MLTAAWSACRSASVEPASRSLTALRLFRALYSTSSEQQDLEEFRQGVHAFAARALVYATARAADAGVQKEQRCVEIAQLPSCLRPKLPPGLLWMRFKSWVVTAM
jgi:hypothetical protein